MNTPMPHLDPYERIAELYDLEHRGHEEDIDFYTRFIEVTGDPVLELGCGTGRLLLPIAEAGYRVTGLDLSQAMLARAHEHVKTSGMDDLVTLFHGSMTQADDAPGGPFGIAILALNGLLHLPTARQQRDTLTAARRALDPRGMLLLDVLNPTPDALHALDDSVLHEGTWTLPDGTRVDKIAARRVSPSTQAIRTELWYDRLSSDGALSRTATSYEMRYAHRAELELMLELAGFVEWQVYGSYDLDPYNEASVRLILAAEVTPSQ